MTLHQGGYCYLLFLPATPSSWTYEALEGSCQLKKPLRGLWCFRDTRVLPVTVKRDGGGRKVPKTASNTNDVNLDGASLKKYFKHVSVTIVKGQQQGIKLVTRLGKKYLHVP